jgi:hypothetical protein
MTSLSLRDVDHEAQWRHGVMVNGQNRLLGLCGAKAAV